MQTRKQNLNSLVLFLAVALLWSVLAYLVYFSLKNNQKNFIYATDDSYIFMSMAENLAVDGHWSADAKPFSSSSSSHLWLIILALGFKIFGSIELLPFTLNMIAGTILVWMIWYLFRKSSLTGLASLFFLSAIILGTPLTSMILTGQEHTLQIISIVLYLYYSAGVITERDRTRNFDIKLILLTVLVTSVRYEGLFAAAMVAILLLFRKNFLLAFGIVVAAWLPIIIYGIVSLSNGWYFFPNSIILKGKAPDVSTVGNIADSLGLRAFKVMYSNPVILLLFITSVITLLFGQMISKGFWHRHNIMLFVYAGMTLLHMQFAGTGSYFRYEAYLVASGVFVIAIAVNAIIPLERFRLHVPVYPLATTMISLSVLLMLVPLGARAYRSLIITPTATMNIYHQQYQMGLFLKEHYNGETVAANDIGAMNFLADLECVDLAGLASLEVADMMRSNSLTTEKIRDLVTDKNARIAIVYDHWFTAIGGLPKEWIKVGEWTIQRNVNVAGSTVSFYATTPEEAIPLSMKLKEYSAKLPPGVIQSGEYTKSR